MEVMNEVSLVNVKVERGLTFTFARHLSYIIAPIPFTRVRRKNYTTVETHPKSLV